MLLAMGKNSVLLAGTAQLRFMGFAVSPKWPPRNHTGPCCPTMQRSPVVSSKGLTEPGIDSAHCHHSADKDAWPASAWASAAGPAAHAAPIKPAAIILFAEKLFRPAFMSISNKKFSARPVLALDPQDLIYKETFIHAMRQHAADPRR
jgi:hypothetical protein